MLVGLVFIGWTQVIARWCCCRRAPDKHSAEGR
jgi:hypothetical protein